MEVILSTSAQAKARIGDAAVTISEYAAATGKPVVMEDLEFGTKKADLAESAPHYARMLSSFAYHKTIAAVRSACFRAGVEFIQVNPAYTSIIGTVNHARVHGISVHQGAAFAIARRALGLSESPTVRKATAPTRNGGHVTFDLPVRNRSKHVWSFWSGTRRRLTAALAAHTRSGGLRSPPAPWSQPVYPIRGKIGPGIECNPGVTGAIPVRESLATLFG
ncbi:MAG: hypothetical protein ACRETQ_09240 [Gammaproteobacteria bacterium]